jgi:hypothetical protein
MKIFHCDHCQHLVFFENVRCVKCEHALAYLPDLMDMGSLEPAGANRWRSLARGAKDKTYRLCENYSRVNVCNWTVPDKDPNPLCRSCRLTRVIPDLSKPEHKQAWYRLEIAKRRLVYSLLSQGLPVASKVEDPDHGLAFEFLSDLGTKVLTGHDHGVITLNIAEADDAERERRRHDLHEPYRTLLGHFRHEIGHYYWDRLIANSDRLEGFRQNFGDERPDYGQALRDYYQKGAPADWQEHFISAYASAHPWEDWAETWAHYLHMTDTLETAISSGLSLQPRRSDEPAIKSNLSWRGGYPLSFERLIENWFPLTYVLNNLNRSLGTQDPYPFVLSATAFDKLRFVHQTVGASQLNV